jgi:hypothetical protein
MSGAPRFRSASRTTSWDVEPTVAEKDPFGLPYAAEDREWRRALVHNALRNEGGKTQDGGSQ